MAIDIAPLRHRLGDELHVIVTLEELEHRALPGPDVPLDGHHEGSVLLHALGRTDGRRSVICNVWHRPGFKSVSISKMSESVQVPHYAEEVLNFCSNFV